MREIGEIELSIQDGTTEIEQLGPSSPSPFPSALHSLTRSLSTRDR
jgi:hypothetical protein